MGVEDLRAGLCALALPIAAVLLVATACAGSETGTEPGASTGVTTSDSIGDPSVATTRTAPAGTKPPAPPRSVAPKPTAAPRGPAKPSVKPTTTTVPRSTSSTVPLKPLTPKCGAVKVFKLVYFAGAAIKVKKASPETIKKAITALDLSAINAQRAVPELAADIKVMHDSQVNRIDGKDPMLPGLAEASQRVNDSYKASCA